jgi:translation initiation factor 2 subunit 2
MDYEKLLDVAYEKLPKVEEGSERFQIPKIDSIIQGNQTIIQNFSQICEVLRRNPKHLLKFLTREFATPGGFDGTRATFQSKIPSRLMEKKLELYVKEYVLCKECKKPDTKLVREDRITFLKCDACGAKSSVKPIK